MANDCDRTKCICESHLIEKEEFLRLKELRESNAVDRIAVATEEAKKVEEQYLQEKKEEEEQKAQEKYK